MDMKRIAKMTENIVAGETNDPLVVIDQALDNIVASVLAISEALPSIKTTNATQHNAITQIQDILDTAISPYTADVIEKFEAFEES